MSIGGKSTGMLQRSRGAGPVAQRDRGGRESTQSIQIRIGGPGCPRVCPVDGAVGVAAVVRDLDEIDEAEAQLDEADEKAIDLLHQPERVVLLDPSLHPLAVDEDEMLHNV